MLYYSKSAGFGESQIVRTANKLKPKHKKAKSKSQKKAKKSKVKKAKKSKKLKDNII